MSNDTIGGKIELYAHKNMFHEPKSLSIQQLTTHHMQLVNETISIRSASDVTLVPKIISYIIESGGKRLRPMLTLAMALAHGYEGEGHILLATAVEFMHTATLLHDDVVDNSQKRRGKLAARLLWGNQSSVLVGDFLLGQAFKMMVDVGVLSCLRTLSSAATLIAEGEVMQLSAANKLDLTEEDYFQIIGAKTAELFSAACEVGPLLTKAPPSQVTNARRYGQWLGMAFQLVDDTLDYIGESAELGKNIGDDLREGKVTLPVILALERSSPAERSFWTSAIGNPDITSEDISQAKNILHTHNTVADSLARAKTFATSAGEALSTWPNSVWKTALLEVLTHSLERHS